jgi:adenylosuccinate synthase
MNIFGQTLTGLVNPSCVGLIGNGVVVHVPSFFEELDALESQGLDCTGRLFVSDRAHLVFDFHQIVDGLKEVELGGSRYVLLYLSPYPAGSLIPV